MFLYHMGVCGTAGDAPIGVSQKLVFADQVYLILAGKGLMLSVCGMCGRRHGADQGEIGKKWTTIKPKTRAEDTACNCGQPLAEDTGAVPILGYGPEGLHAHTAS